MTWVVGSTTIFGYGMAVSDVRVTLSDDSEVDCLQKIYKVGNFIAAGFAGSVAIRFAMIDRLTELLSCDDPGRCWDPTKVAEWWPQDAREVFGSFVQSEQDLQSHIILIGTHPTEHNGNPAWPKNFVYIFRSPLFDAVAVPPPQVGAIGCGTHFDPCRSAVDSISNDHNARFEMMKGEQGCSGGMLNMLGLRLTVLLQETQPRGISSHLHYCWVYRGKVVIAPNNYAEAGRWRGMSAGIEGAEKELRELEERRKSSIIAPGMTAFQMPTVARSWKELEDLLGARAARAVS